MRTILFSAIVLASAFCARAEKPDTIMSVNNPTKITIIENASGMKVSVEGTASDSTFVTAFSKKYDAHTLVNSSSGQISSIKLAGNNAKSYWDASLGSICFGFVNAPGNGVFENEMGKSFEISLPEVMSVGFVFHDTRLSIGAGFGWRNWRMTHDTRFTPENGTISTGTYPDGARPKYSRIKMFSVSFPIMIRQKLPFNAPWGTMSLKAGVILNWNSHASMKSGLVNSDGNESEQSSDNIGQRKFSTDLMGVIGINSWLGVYARYSLTPVFRKHCGPDFKSFSTGIIIGI